MGTTRRRYDIDTDESAVLIEARSNVGPITFGSTAVHGHVELSMTDGIIDLTDPPAGEVVVDLHSLRSGNALYDAELLRRVDARQHPQTVVRLDRARRMGTPDRFELQGQLTFHGVTQAIHGSVAASVRDGDIITVVGEHVFDIRDFNIVAPAVLMLRIYPDVRVQLQLTIVPAPR